MIKTLKFMNIKTIFLLSLISVALISCSVPKFAKPSKTSKDIPVNAQERARQNVEQGRGVSVKKLLKKAPDQQTTSLVRPTLYGALR